MTVIQDFLSVGRLEGCTHGEVHFLGVETFLEEDTVRGNEEVGCGKGTMNKNGF